MSKEHGARSKEQGAGGEEARPAPDAAEDEIVDAEVVDDGVLEEPGAPSNGDVDAAQAAEQAEPDPLAEMQRERDEYLQLAQRARADFENYRRRTAAETTEAERRGRANLAKGMLPALDNLERALLAAGVDMDDEGEAPAEPVSEEVSARDALAAGVNLVLRELRGALERSGVSSYDPVGERFDPALHEAISTAQAEGVEAGVVLETLERGYRVDEQVIRAARVVVAG